MQEAQPSLYADATALIGLARIGQLNLFRLWRTPILVTATVWAEVIGDPEKPGAEAIRRAEEIGLLRVVDEGDATAFPELDAGEATTLSAAMQAHAAVMIDQRTARAFVAKHPGVRDALASLTGVIGLILLAKEQGQIPAVRPLLDDLIQAGFWISAALYRAILTREGEL